MSSNIIEKYDDTLFKYILGRYFTKKTAVGTQKMKNDLSNIKAGGFLRNIVLHVKKTYMCARYGLIQTNYAVKVAITWLFGLKAINLHT